MLVRIKLTKTIFLFSLRRNLNLHHQNKIALPLPKNYRRPLRQRMMQSKYTALDADARDILLDVFLNGEPEECRTLYMGITSFFGAPKETVQNNALYPQAIGNLVRFVALFPEDQTHLFLALRNPTTFIPAMMAEAQTDNLNLIMNKSDPRALRWSDFLKSNRQRFPALSMAICFTEDTPFIWGQFMRLVGGFSPSTPMVGSYSLIESILSGEGFTCFQAYLEKHPKMNERQKRKVMFAFAERFGRADVSEQDVNVPGLDAQMVYDLTAQYEADLANINAISGVRLVLPLGLVHSQRFFIHCQNRLFFGDIVHIPFAKRHNFAQNLGIVSTALGFGHDFLLLIGDILLFNFQTLVAFHKLAKFICCYAIAAVNLVVHLCLDQFLVFATSIHCNGSVQAGFLLKRRRIWTTPRRNKDNR